MGDRYPIIKYDPAVNAVYIRLGDMDGQPVTSHIDESCTIVIDTAGDRIYGIEILLDSVQIDSLRNILARYQTE